MIKTIKTIFNQIKDIFNPRVIGKAVLVANPSSLQRKALWLNIINDPTIWTCKECGYYAQTRSGNGHWDEYACKGCSEYHDYIKEIAPERKDANNYLKELYLYHKGRLSEHNEGLYTLEDYEKD